MKVCLEKEKQSCKENFFQWEVQLHRCTCINIPSYSFCTYITSITTEQLTDEKNVHYVLIQHLYGNCFLSKTCTFNHANIIFSPKRRKLEKTFSFIALISLHWNISLSRFLRSRINFFNKDSPLNSHYIYSMDTIRRIDCKA